MSDPPVPRAPWPVGFPDVVIRADLTARDNHPDFPAAKGGDRAAALRLAVDLENAGAGAPYPSAPHARTPLDSRHNSSYFVLMLATDPPAHDAATARALERLEGLADAGMVLVRALAAEVHAPGRDLLRIANAFARASRSVRLTIMLRARVAREGLAGVAAADAALRAARVGRPAAKVEAESDPPLEIEPVETGRERPDRERGESLGDLTLDETLGVIGEGLGLAAPIDLTAENDDDAIPAVAAMFAQAAAAPRRMPRRSFGAVFDSQVRTLLATTRPP